MLNPEPAPSVLEVLSDEATVAIIGSVLAAQQATVLDDISGELVLNRPLLHKVQEPTLVERPVAAPFLVLVEHLLSRRQQGKMEVVDGADLAKEESEVILLGESGELRNVVQPDVDQPLCIRPTNEPEEPLGTLLGESDRIGRHESPVRTSFLSTYAMRASCSRRAFPMRSSIVVKRSGGGC